MARWQHSVTGLIRTLARENRTHHAARLFAPMSTTLELLAASLVALERLRRCDENTSGHAPAHDADRRAPTNADRHAPTNTDNTDRHAPTNTAVTDQRIQPTLTVVPQRTQPAPTVTLQRTQLTPTITHQ